MVKQNRGRLKTQYFEAARLPAITELFRDYDSALCRAATEGQDKYVLKEKVNNAARIACKSFEGKYAAGMARRLNEVSEDEMAIQENLLFVLDSIMRHATKDGKKTVKRFEQAFSPMLVALFKRALRRLESREVVSAYLRDKLLPTWRLNCWFTKELPRVMKVLDSKPKAERIEVKRAPYSPIRDEVGDEAAFDFTEYDEEGPEAPEGAPWEPAYDAFAARSPYTEPSPYVEEVKEQDKPELAKFDFDEPPHVETLVAESSVPTVVPVSMPEPPEPTQLPEPSPTTPVPSSPSSPTFSPMHDDTKEEAPAVTVTLPLSSHERELTVPAPSSQALGQADVFDRERELTVPVTSSQAEVFGRERELTVPAPSSQAPSPGIDRELTVPVPSSQPSRPSAFRYGQVPPSVPGTREEVPPFIPPHRRVTTQAELEELTMPVPTIEGDSDEDMEIEPIEPVRGAPSDPYLRFQYPGELQQDMTPVPAAGLMTPTFIAPPVIPEFVPSIPPPVPHTQPPSTVLPVTEALDSSEAPPTEAPTAILQTEQPPPSTEPLSSARPPSLVSRPSRTVPTRELPDPVPPSHESVPTEETVPTVSLPSTASLTPQPSTRPSEPSTVPVPSSEPLTVAVPSEPRMPVPSEPPTVPAPTEVAASSRSRIYVPSTPTEVPVPTEEPAPTSPAPSSPQFALEVMRYPPSTASAQTLQEALIAMEPPRALRSKTPTQDASTQPSSPLEMPVPTEVGESEPPTPEEMMATAPVGAPATPPRLMPEEPTVTEPTISVPALTVPRTQVTTLQPVGTRVESTQVPATQVPLMPTIAPMDIVDVRSGPSSPTEVPVPTEAGVSDEEGFMEDAVMPARAPAPQRVQVTTEVPPSPTEMPVPTEQPSPTSMADMDDDTALAQVQAPVMIPGRMEQGGQRTTTAPSSPTVHVPPPAPRRTPAPTSPTDAPSAMRIVPPRAPVSPTAVPTETAGATTRMSALRPGRGTRTRPTIPSSPTEMPVPTEMPSPTSPAPEEDDDVSMALRMLPSRLAQVPPPVPSTRDVEELQVPVPSHPTSRVPTEVYTRGDDNVPPMPVPTTHRPSTQAPTSPPTTQIPPATRTVPQIPTRERRSRPTVPSSPTEMPVPTEMPSPTSPAPMDADQDILQQPPLPPARQPPSTSQVVTLDDEDVVPPAFPPRAGQQTAYPVQSSPTEGSLEPPVPGQRPGVRSRQVPSSPTEGSLAPPAPGQRPSVRSRSPTEGSLAPPAPGDERPVPTDVASPTEMEFRPVVRQVPTEVASPTEMDIRPMRPQVVPTEVPSERIRPVPTSPSHMDLQPPGQVPAHVRSRQPTSPSEMPVPTEPGEGVGTARSRPRVPSSPTEMPVPTELPSPTSPAPMDHDYDIMQQPLPPASLRPIGERALARDVEMEEIGVPAALPPSARAPELEEIDVPAPVALPPRDARTPVADVETEMPVPPQMPAPRALVMSRPRPTSPSEMPVPTEMPSPTSPGPVDTHETTIEAVAPTHASSEISLPAPRVVPSSDVPPTAETADTVEPQSTEMTEPPPTQSQSAVHPTLEPPTLTMEPPVATQTMPLEPDTPMMRVPDELFPPPPRPPPAFAFDAETDELSVPPMLVPTEVRHPSTQAPSSPSAIQIAAATQRVPQAHAKARRSRPTQPTSPTEMPVPTELPSPTSPAPMEADLDIIQEPPVLPARQPSTVQAEADDDEDLVPYAPPRIQQAGQPVPSSPTEMPAIRPVAQDVPPVLVPTVPGTMTQAPSSPSATQIAATQSIPQAQTRARRSRPTVPSSPTEMPVPTELPSPTSPAPMEADLDIIQEPPVPVRRMTQAEADEDEDLVPPVLGQRLGVRSRQAPSSPTELPEIRPVVQDAPPMLVPTEMGTIRPSTQAPSSPTATQIPTQVPATATHSVPQIQTRERRSRPTVPTSPTEMPVPTELPSPTSPAPVDTETAELDVLEEPPLLLPGQRRSAPQAVDDDEDEVPPALPPRALQQAGRILPSSPTELPGPAVPQVVPAPSSPTELPGPAVPAMVPTDVASERRIPVPGQQRRHTTRGSKQPSSPSEMPVPTELPSPTSLAASMDEDYDITQQPPLPPGIEQTVQTVIEGVPETEEIIVPTALPPRDERTPRDVETEMPLIAVPSRPRKRPDAPTDEPSEMPVPSLTRRRIGAPTDEPSELPVPGMPARRVGVSTHRTERSPTEMPVPTQMPSPTSPAADEDEEMQAVASTQPAGFIGVGPPLGTTLAQPPSSPTELPQLYDPTSPAEDEDDAREEPPLVAPTRTFQTSIPTTEPPPTMITTEPPLEVPTTLGAPSALEVQPTEIPPTVETVEPPSSEPPPTFTFSTVPPTLEPPTLEPPTREAESILPPQPAPLEPDTPAVAQVLMMRFPDAPFPPPAKFKTELIRSLRALGATRLSDLALRLREGLLAEVRGPPAALAALRELPLQNLRVIRYKISEIQGPGTEASLKWFKTKVRAPLAPAPQEPSISAPTLQSPVEHSSMPTLLGPPGTPSEVTRLHTPTQASPAEPYSASGVTRVHSHSVGFTRPSPAEMTRPHSPTEVFSREAAATPTQRLARGFKAPLTPQGQVVSSTGEVAPGTPTYSPTEFFADPATPQEMAVTRALRRAVAPSAEHEASSPTYLEEGRELPLPPTPTYSAGSSPTFVEENEPPTPTLEADDDDFADDTSVADWMASATPKLIPATGTPQSGPSTPASRAVGTPSTVQPSTPLGNFSLSSRPVGAMRLPGMESPTPTYEPDDETVYGDDASSVASWVASGTPRAFDGTSSLPGTPLSIGPTTPLGRVGTPQGGPIPPTQPTTPVGYVQSLGQIGPGTPVSAASTPHMVGSVPAVGTPPGSQPGTPQSYQPGTPQGRQPGTPQQVLPGSSTAAASSSEAPAPGRLASEVFPQLAGKRKQGGGASSDEELPPWKRRAQRRKKQ